jgi:multiple sugar transport system substrate-binding protein
VLNTADRDRADRRGAERGWRGLWARVNARLEQSFPRTAPMGTHRRGRAAISRRGVGLLAAAGLVAATALTGCGGDSGVPVLTWYINPDAGTQQALAKKCTEAADGRYEIRTALLPRDSTAQREQLVRRLAAQDSGIDLMSLDVPYLAEFANAGFVRKFSAAERERFTEGMLAGPVESALWKDDLFAVPFNTNTQLLWYRKSVAEEAGLSIGPDTQVTWEQVISAAEDTNTKVQVQAKRYEGYTVLINSLIASAGGSILENPEAGKEVKPALNSDAGRQAAEVIRTLARSSAAPVDISNSDEGTGQAGFLADNGGFMTNWPFVYAAADDEAKQDFGWARWPSVVADRPSAPPLGGINLAVGAFTEHPAEAVDAVECVTSADSQKEYMLKEGLLSTYEDVYDDPEVQEAFPMYELLRASVDDAAPRPITPYYPDITAAIQRGWHPPAAVSDQVPARTADLIVAILHDDQLS